MMDLNKQQKDAVQWLSNEIENIPNIVFRKPINQKKKKEGEELTEEEQQIITIQEKRRNPPLAELVLFRYEAKFGNVFGYWDKFPIVLIVRPFEDHCFGFNLHYLDLKTREKILRTVINLHRKVPNKKTMYKAIYPFLDALVKIGYYNFAYKNYSYSNITSEFVIIKPEHYQMVANLPIARFQGNRTDE